MNNNEKTILVVPMSAIGHVNACTGALSSLLKRLNRPRIVFLLEEAFKGTVTKLGYEECLFSFSKPDETSFSFTKNPILQPWEKAAKVLRETGVIGGSNSPYEKLFNLIHHRLHGPQFMGEFAAHNAEIEKAIAKLKPDLIYFDALFLHPAIHYSSIPWINNCSAQPLYYINNVEVLPPGCSGIPEIESKSDFAKKFRQLRSKVFTSTKFNDLIEKLGYPRYPNDTLVPGSQILTVYAYPEELNYEYIRKLPNWFNLEVFNLLQQEDFSSALENLGIPKSFLSETLKGIFSGKYILVSLGSMTSIDLTLMKKLVTILGSTNHKYIVSKGPRHAKYSLAENMWGARFIENQLQVAAHCQLVISHGGNNTTTEVFALGKPLIIFPNFGDQFDKLVKIYFVYFKVLNFLYIFSAQRITEKGYGMRLDPNSFTEKQLKETIETLLNDAELNVKCKLARQRIEMILNSKYDMLADKIEQLLKTSQ